MNLPFAAHLCRLSAAASAEATRRARHRRIADTAARAAVDHWLAHR